MFHRHMTSDMTPEERQAFEEAVRSIFEISPVGSIFAADDVIAFDRNVGFLSEHRFLQALSAGEPTYEEQQAAWRLHTLCWAGDHASRMPGEFVQCGARSGVKAAVVARYVDLGGAGKSLHIFDPDAARRPDAVGVATARRQRLEALGGVILEKETTVAAVVAAAPSKIAWLHLDLAQADAEEMILEALIGRVAPNGLVIVEEYGSNRCADRVASTDRIAAANGCVFMELPTGQGLLIKA